MAQKFRAELIGRDWIELEIQDSGQIILKGMGCSEFLAHLKDWRERLSKNPIAKAELPAGNSHSEILVREVILKAQGLWQYPYQYDELCHCRTIATAKVDAAIVAGAHTPAAVSRLTSASTACGTCRPEVQKIIDFRLGKKTA